MLPVTTRHGKPAHILPVMLRYLPPATSAASRSRVLTPPDRTTDFGILQPFGPCASTHDGTSKSEYGESTITTFWPVSLASIRPIDAPVAVALSYLLFTGRIQRNGMVTV